jgi:hypothetical protein
MSLLTNQTSLNNSEFFFLRGTGSQISVSTINANTISTNTATAALVSTSVLDANDINASTIFAYEVFIDNQGLTATPSELLLNGIPLATTANLSSIQDWATFPAVSTLDMNTNNIIGANNVVASNINAGTGIFNNLFANNIFALSTYTSTISSVAEVADFAFIGSLSTGLASGGDFQPSTLWGKPSSFYDDPISTITASTIDVEFASISSLSVSSINGGNEIIVSSIQGNQTLDLTSDQDVSLAIPKVNITAKNGLGGNITLTADTGAGGTSFGAINLVANGGTTEGVGTGGSITIQANTPLGTLETASSKVTIDAAGVNVYAGAVAPVASLTGYLFQYGTLGINQCVGLPSVVPNFPGTFYQYATGGVGYGGIRMESPGGVEMINSTDFYPYRIYPYYNTFLVGTHPDLTITGRSNLVGNNQYLMLSSVKGLEFGFDETAGEIKGLSSINGQPLSFYEPGGESTISSFVELNTALLNTSSINFPGIPGTGISGDDAFTSIQGINYLFSKNSEFSTLQGEGGGNLQITTPATAPVLNASTINVSTATVQGQIIIEPSTTRSGIYMPFDATNGTGVVAVGLSTSVSIFEKYAALLALATNPIGEPPQESFGLLQTSDNEVSFQYADLELGRVILTGSNNYGTYTSGYLTGDGAGNLTAVATSLNTSSLVASTLKLSPSTILYSATSDAEVVCGTASDPDDYAQIAASALRLTSSSTASNGTIVYGSLTDRLLFVNSGAETKTLAYTVDSNISISSLTVSSINNLQYQSYFCSAYDSTSQTVAGANISTPLVWNTTSINVGDFTVGTSTIQVPVAGVYENSLSAQFDTSSGGTNSVEFWLTKNGAAVGQTNSIASITNNGETLGTITIFDTAAAGDQYGWMFYSADANMSASATAAGATPAIPSVVFNTKRLG